MQLVRAYIPSSEIAIKIFYPYSPPNTLEQALSDIQYLRTVPFLWRNIHNNIHVSYTTPEQYSLHQTALLRCLRWFSHNLYKAWPIRMSRVSSKTWLKASSKFKAISHRLEVTKSYKQTLLIGIK